MILESTSLSGVLLQVWIIDSSERVDPHDVGVLLQI